MHYGHQDIEIQQLIPAPPGWKAVLAAYSDEMIKKNGRDNLELDVYNVHEVAMWALVYHEGKRHIIGMIEGDHFEGLTFAWNPKHETGFICYLDPLTAAGSIHDDLMDSVEILNEVAEENREKKTAVSKRD